MGLGQGPQGPFHPLLTPDPCPATRLSPLPPDLDNGWSEASSQDLQWLQFTTMDPEQMALLQSCAMVIQFPQSQWQLQKVLVLGVPGPQNVYKKIPGNCEKHCTIYSQISQIKIHKNFG